MGEKHTPDLLEAVEAAIAVADWVIDFKGSSPSDCDLARMISQPLRQAIAKATGDPDAQ